MTKRFKSGENRRRRDENRRNLDRSHGLTYNEVYVEENYVTMTVPQMALPESLPVFPLTGVMLLPGTVLPLHIFEPRYRAMVEDALEADKIFGMIIAVRSLA